MEDSKFVLFLILLVVLMLIPVLLPYAINRHIIKKKLLRQERAIQAQFNYILLNAKHAFSVEPDYALMMMFVAIPFIILIFFHVPEASVNEMIRQIPFHGIEDYVGLLGLLVYYMIVLLVCCLLNLLALRVRRALGVVQGAVLFDPQEKKVYVFPSIDSDDYKEYHESELTYTTETYGLGKGPKNIAYVFFTRTDKNYAFKIDSLQYNNFEEILSRREAIDIHIPFKYGFHTYIIGLMAIAFFTIGTILVSYYGR